MQKIIDFFITNKVAANLLMLSIFILGVLNTMQNKVEFFPTLDVPVIVAEIAWEDSSPLDVSRYIIEPLKSGFSALNRLKDVTSSSFKGRAVLMFSFTQGTDMQKALQDVEKMMLQYRAKLPSNIEDPFVQQATFTQNMMELVIASQTSIEELIPLARQYEKELINLGVGDVQIMGMPEKKIVIELDQLALNRLNMTPQSVYTAISRENFDIDLGVVGSDQKSYNLRINENKRSVESLATTIVRKNTQGIILLQDIARIYESYEGLAQPNQLLYKNKTSVSFKLLASEGQDVVEISKKVVKWFEKTKYQAAGIAELHLLNESWRFIESRANLVLKNAISGLLLVMLVLLIFVNQKIALWAMVGAVTAFAGSLSIIYYLGQTINMISLFGFVLATGMVVDDAIVVGEQIYYQRLKGKSAYEAASIGANRMWKAVLASTFTTVGAFLPLMFVGDVMGQILKVLPIVVISVLVVSLVECFLILPHHLKSAFSSDDQLNPNTTKQAMSERRWFVWVREKIFAPAIETFVRWPFLTLVLLIVTFVFSIQGAKKIPFVFFPSPDGNVILGTVDLLPATSLELRNKAQARIHQAMQAVNQKYNNEKLVNHYYTNASGNNISVFIELQDVEKRLESLIEVRKSVELTTKEYLVDISEIEKIYFSELRGGPPGEDISVDLKGTDIHMLKKASLDLQNRLSDLPAAYSLRDNMPYGKKDLVLSLNNYGRRLGLSMADIRSQLSLSFSSRKVDEFVEDRNTVRINLQLPESDIESLNYLNNYRIKLPAGGRVQLKDIVTFDYQDSFPRINSLNGAINLRVEGSVNAKIKTANEINAFIKDELIPQLKEKYPNIDYELSGADANQARTAQDMQVGSIIGLSLIYIVLALFFGRYSTPAIIIYSLPLLWVGVVFVYLITGFEFTLLTIFGIFGLLGIAVNNCIIWVDLYFELKNRYPSKEAALRASLLRLRPILCTSLTTIMGLTPLLFETSLQAQFLKPMVLVIVGGLGFSIVLVLFCLPSLFLVIENIKQFFRRLLGL